MTARYSPCLTRVRSQPLPFRRESAAFPFGRFNEISPGSTSRRPAALQKLSSRTAKPSQPLQRALAPTNTRTPRVTHETCVRAAGLEPPDLIPCRFEGAGGGDGATSDRAGAAGAGRRRTARRSVDFLLLVKR